MVSRFCVRIAALLLLSLLGSVKTSNAADVTINIASLSHLPECHGFSCSSEVVKATRVDPADPRYAIHLAMQGYVAVEDRIRALGGIPVGDDRVFLNITHFDYSPVNAGSNTARTDARTIGNALVSGVYGHFPVWLVHHARTGAFDEFAQICDSTKACVIVTPLASTRGIFVCTPTNGVLPPDCLAAGKVANQRRFEHIFTVLPDTTVLLTGWVQLAKYKQTKTMAILARGGDSLKDAVANLDVIAESLHIRVVYQYYTEDPDAYKPGEARAVVANMSRANPDVVAILGFGTTRFVCEDTINEMHRVGWAPKYGIASGGNCLVASRLGEKLAHTMYDVPWHQEARGPEYRAVNTGFNFEPYPASDHEDIPQVFTRDFQSQYPEYPLSVYPYAALGAQAAIVIQKMIQFARVANATAEDFRLAAYQLAEPSLLGRLQFDHYGRHVPPEMGRPVVQFGLGDRQTLVTPFALGRDPVWPFPSWAERTPSEVDGAVSSPGEKIVYAIASLCIVYAGGLLWLMIKYRDTNTVRAATPVFCYLTLIGSMVWMSTVFVWTEHETTSTCNAKIWLLQLGFTMTYSAIFIKTFRLWRIFLMVKLQVVRITNRDLLLAFAVWLAVETIYTVVWLVVSPTEQERVVVDPLRPAFDYFICSRDATHNGFAAGAVAIKGAMVFIGCLVTWATRKIPGDFNESKYIGLSVYNLFFLAAIAVPIIALEAGSRAFNFFFRTFAILFVGMTSITLIFLPKVWAIERDGDVNMQFVQHHTMIEDQGNLASPQGPRSSSNGGGPTPAEIRAARARVAELERQLSEVRAQSAQNQERIRFYEKQFNSVQVVELPGCPS